MASDKDKEQGRTAQGLLIGGVGGAALAAAIAVLLAARPARAAPTDEKLDYLIEVLTTLIPLLAEVSQRQASLIELLEELLGRPPEDRAPIIVLAPWVTKEPEEIYRFAIRTAGTFYSNKMVDWTGGKRLLVKVESSLDQAVEIQLIGNIVDDMELATDIDIPKTCPANDNISIGPAWDHWCPYIGVRITAAAAPTSGFLTISAVSQE